MQGGTYFTGSVYGTNGRGSTLAWSICRRPSAKEADMLLNRLSVILLQDQSNLGEK